MNVMKEAHKATKAQMVKAGNMMTYRAVLRVCLRHFHDINKAEQKVKAMQTKSESKYFVEIRDFATGQYKTLDLRTLPAWHVEQTQDAIDSWTIKGTFKTEEGVNTELTSGFHHSTFERNMQYWKDNKSQYGSINFLVLVDDVPYRLTF